MNYGDCFRSASPDHFSNGGTGVTNFTNDRRAIYEKAVELHGDPDLWVSEKSFGDYPDYGGALHCKSRKDLSDFWALFYKIKASSASATEESEK